MEKMPPKILKIMLAIFMSLTFLSVLLPDEFVIGILKLGYRPDPFQMFIRWFKYVSFIVLPVAVIYQKPIFKKIAVYFCLPVVVIWLFMFPTLYEMFISPQGTGIADMRCLPDFIGTFMRNGVFRTILFFTTALLEIGIIVSIIFSDKESYIIKKNDIIPFILILVLSTISIMPIYALETIFDTHTNIVLSWFSLSHIMWIIFLPFEAFILIKIFKKKSEEDRNILVLILSLCLLIQFNQLFSTLGEVTIERLPFMLCNVAAYITVLSVAFKIRGLYIFNILVNVLGGIIALIVLDCDVNGQYLGIFAKDNIHYIAEHNKVILIPILCFALGIFKPFEKKDYKLFVKIFSCYFVLVFILGTLFNTIGKIQGEEQYFYCNYMYLFDPETAGDLIPFTKPLFDVNFSIGNAVFYPIVQPAIYLLFIGVGSVVFTILYKISNKKGAVKKLK